MQNPFRPRSQDDFGRRHPDDDRGWEARDRRYDEDTSWSEGDGGRTAEAWRRQGQYERYATDDRDRGPYRQGDYDRPSGWSADRSHDRRPYASAPDYGRDRDHRPSSSYGQNVSRDQDYGRRDSGWGQGRQDGADYYGHSTGYPDRGYAPGAQIWQGRDEDDRSSRSQHDFEPDYLHWRNQQMSNFDRDYSDWRSERREKFSTDFDSWRSSRPRVQAENPIVGDVSDGGVGDASDVKKR